VSDHECVIAFTVFTVLTEAIERASIVIYSFLQRCFQLSVYTVAWWCGYSIGLVIKRSSIRLPAMFCRVST